MSHPWLHLMTLLSCACSQEQTLGDTLGLENLLSQLKAGWKKYSGAALAVLFLVSCGALEEGPKALGYFHYRKAVEKSTANIPSLPVTWRDPQDAEEKAFQNSLKGQYNRLGNSADDVPSLFQQLHPSISEWNEIGKVWQSVIQDALELDPPPVYKSFFLQYLYALRDLNRAMTNVANWLQDSHDNSVYQNAVNAVKSAFSELDAAFQTLPK
jgi:hypothetical protein